MPFTNNGSSPIHSIGDFVETVLSLREEAGSLPIWYRGHSRADYPLIPSIGRGDFSLNDERTLTNNFKKNAIPYVERRPTSEWEWLFLMRHHEVPTRLLDWTESAPVGLFFAANSLPKPEEHDDEAGALWVLSPAELNKDAGISFDLAHDLPMFEDDDRHMANYLPSRIAMETMSQLRPAAALPARQSRRMEMQHSVFTVTHRDLEPLETSASQGALVKFIIPAEAKLPLRKALEALGFSQLGLFPDLDNVGKAARSTYA